MKHVGFKQYQEVNVQTSLVDADPHRLIQMLMQGAIDRMIQAKGRIAYKDPEGRNTCINKAVGIIDGLMGSLDKEKGGEIAANLDRLYDYMIRRLFEANVHNDAEMVDEVIQLMSTVKEGWDGIAPVRTGAVSAVAAL